MKSLIPLISVIAYLLCNAANAQTTVTLNPSQDAYTSSKPTQTNTNYGSSTAGNADVTTSTEHTRLYLNFSLSGIPSNAIIHSAELKLKPTGVGEGGAGSSSFVLQTVTSSWIETGGSSITNSNQPSSTSVGQVSSSSLVSGLRVFDVKTLVQSYIDGTSYHGWMIRRDPETTTTSPCQYYLKETGTSGNRPQLVITYYLPMSVTAASITHATTASSSDGSITPTLSGGSGSATYQWFNSAGSSISGATSSSISSRSYGWYGLRATGQYGDVYYFAFLIGAQSEPVSITFNPGPNYIDDALINNHTTGANANYGLSNQLQASSWTSGTWFEARSMLRFRLWFDPALTPLTANLLLKGADHSTAGRPNNGEFQLTTQQWDEKKVTYNNQPTFSNTVLADMPATTSSTENRTVDLTAFWNTWKASNTTNYGMTYKLDTYATQYAKQVYHSSDASNPSNYPYLQFILDMAAADRTSYATFRPNLDAGCATAHKGRLKIQFDEAYKQASGKKVTLTLYDENHVIKGAIGYDGSAVSGNPLLPAIVYSMDDNRGQLNLTTFGLTVNKTYILELQKSTGEKEYIKFVYSN